MDGGISTASEDSETPCTIIVGAGMPDGSGHPLSMLRIRKMVGHSHDTSRVQVLA